MQPPVKLPAGVSLLPMNVAGFYRNRHRVSRSNLKSSLRDVEFDEVFSPISCPLGVEYFALTLFHLAGT